ncbi:hypothetical protein [Enterococcus ureasiticus]|uniref:Uncharacterized protein n=1 Tax=Enterococcus ureasiticus TaxID=903984 RepID=A0A1E5GL87_9ENTE|nr:hypothetical protein [Enterococcus ureasiticus]OEG13431.1 hypothetical protein BCR21_00090 [Enterococcus ureasiticus]
MFDTSSKYSFKNTKSLLQIIGVGPQAMQWSKKEYEDAGCGSSAVVVDGTNKYFAAEENEVTDHEKLDFLRLNAGRTFELRSIVTLDQIASLLPLS